MWSLCLAEEERGPGYHRAARDFSLIMQVPTDVLDEGEESDDNPTISNSSKSLFQSRFKEDVSNLSLKVRL